MAPSSCAGSECKFLITGFSRTPDRAASARRCGPARMGSKRCNTLNGELYRSPWFVVEALARADLATCQDALAAAGWTPVAFQP